MQNKGLIIAGGCLGLILIIGIIIAFSLMRRYNSFAIQEKIVEEKWAEVENQFKRRFDLIPNLANVAEKFSDHEKEIYDRIVEGRKAYNGAQSIEDKMTTATQLDNAMLEFRLVVEDNPQIKSDRLFSDLMASLEGTENRIAVARQRYNEAVRLYNTSLAVFPGRIYASIFGFKEKTFFEVSEEEQQPVKVFEKEEATAE